MDIRKKKGCKQWRNESLIPTLQPGNVVIMDNASFHKGNDIKIVIKNAGYKLLYLPIYAPYLYSIEHTWTKWKNIIRHRMRKNYDFDSSVT